MFIKLSELWFDTYIIGTHKLNDDISFINQSIKIRIIKNNFSEIKERDYDILMVNSDQTWTKMDKHFYDIAFLRFAKKWRKKKFIYGASLGYDYWTFTQEDEKMAKGNLKRFTGISVREKGSISKIEKHLNFKPILVLDPTLLINKKYYLNLITNYKGKRISNKYKYIFTYIFLKENNTLNFIKNSALQLGYKIFNVKKKHNNSIKKFIYGIYNCHAVITNSYHGTIFSIIFKKPFISFIIKDSPRERLISLKETFRIKNRIFEYNQTPDINLLTIPLNINYTLIDNLREKSINYLKKNLGL